LSTFLKISTIGLVKSFGNPQRKNSEVTRTKGRMTDFETTGTEFMYDVVRK
jgi:hypothetical protein